MAWWRSCPASRNTGWGPRLAELGGALRRQYGHRDVLRRHLEGLVAETGLVCVIGQVLGDESSFVIIDQIAPPGAKSRNLAFGIPPHRAGNGPRAPELHGRGERARRNPRLHREAEARGGSLVARQLREIRGAGYATSVEQYKHGVNAVASPIERAGEAYLVAAFVAHARDLSGRRMEEIGPKLAKAARQLSEGPREA